MQRKNQPIEIISKDECHQALIDVAASIESRMDVSNQNFLRSILKFANRVQCMPTSKLTNAFHTFGAKGVTHARATATSIVRKAKRGKIYVQPEAVTRRKLNSGSRAKQSKGQVSKNNPFSLKPSRGKRLHQFAHNVRQNQPVSKKAGRTMATKTRCYESTGSRD